GCVALSEMRFEVGQGLSRENFRQVWRWSDASGELEQDRVFVRAAASGNLGVVERHVVFAQRIPIRVQNGAIVTECRSREVRDQKLRKHEVSCQSRTGGVQPPIDDRI